MLAKHEVRTYSGSEKVWVGKYKNSHNLLHWHYDCELICVESGEIDVFCDEKNYTLMRDEAMFIDSGKVHYMHAKPGTILMVFIFDNNIVKEVTGKCELQSAKLTRGYGIASIYSRIKDELQQQRPFYNLRVKSEITDLIIDIFRSECIVQSDDDTAGTVHSFKRLFNEINDKFEFYSFTDAAAFMGMSSAYFSRLFHQMTGMTFSRYLNHVKVENAIRALHENPVAITDVSIKCGFATIRNFNRTFKELTGYSPKKLPAEFTLDEKFAYISDKSFNPTLRGCELIDTAV